MDSPVLDGISNEKLNILNDIVNNANGKTPKELISYFIKATNEAAKSGVYFNNEETELIIDVLKQNMTPEEIKRMDSVKKLSQMLSKKL